VGCTETDPSTRPSLIVRIRAPDDAEAWGQFVAVYGPLVHRFARRHGLQDADAADLTQEVLRAVARAAGGLDHRPDRGSFRRWLFTVARNRLIDFCKSAQRREQGAGDTDALDRLAQVPAPHEEPDWDRDYERQVLGWAADRVRPEFQETTWRAFWLTAVEGRPGPEAAAALGMSLGAVHVARSRVLARLRAVVRELMGEEE
jgi:RNA polymerase sigma-70 factor (ECF subfamily)